MCFPLIFLGNRLGKSFCLPNALSLNSPPCQCPFPLASKQKQCDKWLRVILVRVLQPKLSEVWASPSSISVPFHYVQPTQSWIADAASLLAFSFGLLPLPGVLCCCLVTKSFPTHCDPIDCSPLGFSVLGIFQARILEWVAISSRRSSWPRDWICVSSVFCIVGRFFPLSHWGKVPRALFLLPSKT